MATKRLLFYLRQILYEHVHVPDLLCSVLRLVSPAPVSARGSGRGKLQSVLCRAARSHYNVTRGTILQTAALTRYNMALTHIVHIAGAY